MLEILKGAIDLGVFSHQEISEVDDIGFSEGPVKRDTEDYWEHLVRVNKAKNAKRCEATLPISLFGALLVVSC